MTPVSNKTTNAKNPDWSMDELVTEAYLHYDVKIEDLMSDNKNRKLVDARSILAYITRKSNKWSLEDLTVILKKHTGTLSRLATRAQEQPELFELIQKTFTT